MRILLTGDMSGTRDGQQWPPRGSTVDLPDDEAVVLLRGGMAKTVPDVEERAVVPDGVVHVSTPLTTDTGPVPRRRRGAVAG